MFLIAIYIAYYLPIVRYSENTYCCQGLLGRGSKIMWRQDIRLITKCMTMGCGGGGQKLSKFAWRHLCTIHWLFRSFCLSWEKEEKVTKNLAVFSIPLFCFVTQTPAIEKFLLAFSSFFLFLLQNNQPFHYLQKETTQLRTEKAFSFLLSSFLKLFSLFQF